MQRILLVEDDEDVRTVLIEALRTRLPELAVDGAPSAEAASALVAGRAYDLVVSDYRLPGMDGLEFLRRVRRLQPQAAGMLLTAFHRGLDVGDVPMLEKPMSGDAFARLVRTALARAARPILVHAA